MIILITGAGSGIGKALSIYFSNKQNIVLAVSKSKKKIFELKVNYNNIIPFQCDVSKEDQVKKLHKRIIKKFSKIDVIINNAGIYGEVGRFYQSSFRKWKAAIEVNFFGTFLICKYFFNLLKKSKYKKIINFAGGGAFNALPNLSSYACSKSAVVRFSETISKELYQYNIKVNCVAPGFVDTEIHNSIIKAEKKKVGTSFYNHIIRKKKEGGVSMKTVISCVNFLVSTRSRNLTGKTISASFDKWNSKSFQKKISLINSSNRFTMTRVN
jgi:3-oxoacyl-[acyl-carrier protein] reductase